MSEETQDWSKFVLLAIALVAMPTSLWMLFAPEHWYSNFPAEIPDFGAFNVHFVRDLGCIYLTWSVAAVWAALRPAVRPAIVSIAALFFWAHAIIHIFDTLRGHVHASHFLLDFPTTYLPAILLLFMLYGTKRIRTVR